jgi:hypothetical protein
MNRSLIRVLLASLTLALAAGMTSTAKADDCVPPKLLSSLPMEKVPGGDTVTVAATLDGSPQKLIVDIGTMPTQLWNREATKLGLPIREGARAGRFHFDFGGRFSEDIARVQKFTLGSMETGGFNIQVVADPDVPQGTTDGVLGTDMMQRYDIDLDFAHQQLNYFSPEQCNGAGIYWKPKSVVGQQMVTYTGLVYVPVTLDGHTILALLDSGVDRTFLNPRSASKLFGLSWGSLEPGNVTDDGALIKADLHPFSRLTLAGLTINNPEIAIPDDIQTQSTREFHAEHLIPDRFPLDQIIKGDIVIGMDVLKQTHLYLSFRNNRIYVSPAGDGEALKQPVPPQTSWLTVWQREYDRYQPFVRY